ncbi:MAG: type II toxin-antitoxin system VapC family toxin [Solirubrobacteraceae bacterium]
MPSQSLVVDTHAWLWSIDSPAKLSSVAREAIDTAETLFVSTVSCWEITALSEAGRIELDRPIQDWVRDALAESRSVALPLDSETAIAAALLSKDGFHGDPADRFIYATAVAQGAKLVTKDRRMREFDPRRTIW